MPSSGDPVLRQLIVLGYLSVDTGGFGALQLTEPSRALLRGDIELPLRRDLLVPRETSKSRQKSKARGVRRSRRRSRTVGSAAAVS